MILYITAVGVLIMILENMWINEKRLEKAEVLLQTTDYLITDICFLCGYESLSNFIYQFKKIYNISPAKYRKNS